MSEPTNAQWNAALDVARNQQAATEESQKSFYNDPVVHRLETILENWKREIERNYADRIHHKERDTP